MNNDDYLLLDTSLWAQADHLKLTQGPAHKASENPLFGEEMPWEVRYDNLYAYVIFDPTDNLCQCWYNPVIFDEATTDTPTVQRERGVYRAALADVDGKGLANLTPVQADVTDLPLQWRDGQNLAEHVGR